MEVQHIVQHVGKTILFGKPMAYPKDKTIHQLFEEQCQKTPNNVAIVFENQYLTYQELNQKINQLAHYLVKQGVGSNSLVAICLERSLEMVIGILGILKAEGAYVPIDPNYPNARIQYMLEDAHALMLLTQEKFKNKCCNFFDSNKIISLDYNRDVLEKECRKNILNVSDSSSLVYVIYTSGSTGKPKGVLNVHRGLCNRLYWMQQEYCLSETDIVLQKTPFTFDVSVWEFFWPLLFGAKLVIAKPEGHKDPKYLSKIILDQKVTIIHFVPSMLGVFVDQAEFSKCSSLRKVICSGEKLTFSLQERFFASSHAELHNLYGPTEASIDVSYWFSNSTRYKDKVPIGRPIANTQFYVLDKNTRPVSIGNIGELFIGGDGLARGYLNQPELTQEKFIHNPFSDDSKDRLYRTGDFVRQLPDGNLEFIGRIDDQVKIRGFRIEPAEIETYLQQYSGIDQSIVVAREDQQGTQYLVAYLVSKDQSKLDLKKLRDYLKDYLPDYMIPSTFVVLNQLPLTANGKIDRQALKTRKDNQDIQPTHLTPPTTPDEKLLVAIWSDVLKISPRQFGIYDNFFEIGGHSLLAHHVIIRIRVCFSVNLTVSDIFNYPTIKFLVERINKINKDKDFISIKVIDRKQDIPLSFTQHLIWWHQQLAPCAPIYNETMNIHIQDEINVTVLEKSINALIKRYEILRARIYTINGKPYQKVVLYRYEKIPFISLCHLSADQREKAAIDKATIDVKKRFQLDKDSLIRFLLIQLDKNDFRLFITVHHLVIDGISLFQIFVEELETLYLDYLEQKSSSLPELSTQYLDFALWEQKYYTAQYKIMLNHIDYWKRYLNRLSTLKLPSQRNISTDVRYRGKRQCLVYPKKLIDKLKRLSQQESVTLFTTLFTAFNILLYRYTHQADIPLWTVVSNRYLSETEKMLGNFLNTIILRSNLSDNPSFKQLLIRTWFNLKATFSHQILPFQEIYSLLKDCCKNRAVSPIQVAFIYEPTMHQSKLGWSLSQLEVHPETTKFDLTFELDVRTEGIIGRVEYSTDLFDDWFIQQMINHYEVLLNTIVEDIDRPIAELPLLTAQEEQMVLLDWNNTKADYPRNKTLHQLFEAQAEKTPEQVAVVFKNRQLTYRELNQQANQLAHYLGKQGVVSETLVAICAEHNLELIIGILGILKAGGAYIPVDPGYPQVRIQYILEDAKVNILLTQSEFKRKNVEYSKKLIFLDEEHEVFEKESKTNPNIIIQSNNLAYVIYTSGSTGQPKGVMVEHAGVINLALSEIRQFNLNTDTRTLAFSSISFDAAVGEYFSTLFCGGTLYLENRENLYSEQKLADTITRAHITFVTLPPTMLKALNHEKFPRIKTIVSAGEPCSRDIVLKWKNNSDQFINAYGPTEITVCASLSFCECDKKVTIGKPIANTRVFVLDSQLKCVPIGVMGELYIGGAGLARGYLNQPELTQEKFISNPFGKGRLYKTGDLVRWLPDGNLEFIGRIDDQVKIRGFRIECGEVETNLLQYAGVQACAVVARQYRGNESLVAYLSVKKPVDFGKVREFLKRKLPDYMIPSVFVILDQLPRTSNGKTDKKALSNFKIQEQQRQHIKPPTKIEKTLVTIWAKILNMQNISVNDDFFDLGGHSIKIMQLIPQINQMFSISLNPEAVCQYPTVAKLSKKIQHLISVKKKITEDMAVGGRK